MPNTKEPITIESALRKFVHSCYVGCTKSELEILRQEAELALSPLEQSEKKEEWVSVTEPNINWPDCEVLGYDSAVKRYGVGKLACFANGNVYLEDAFENYIGYATHYKVLKPPKNIV